MLNDKRPLWVRQIKTDKLVIDAWKRGKISDEEYFKYCRTAIVPNMLETKIKYKSKEQLIKEMFS